jgi:hypothetical protein
MPHRVKRFVVITRDVTTARTFSSSAEEPVPNIVANLYTIMARIRNFLEAASAD